MENNIYKKLILILTIANQQSIYIKKKKISKRSQFTSCINSVTNCIIGSLNLEIKRYTPTI